MSQNLHVRVEDRDGAAVVVPVGEIDLSCSPDLRVALQQALLTNPTALLVDMTGVPSIDSSGVATFIEAMRETQSRKISLVLCALVPRVLAVFEIARLDRVFSIQADLDTALAGAGE